MGMNAKASIDKEVEKGTLCEGKQLSAAVDDKHTVEVASMRT